MLVGDSESFAHGTDEGGGGEKEDYQFAAMMAFPRGLMRLDFGFILIFGFEDLFFFFWSSRPMIVVSNEGGLLELCG